MKDIFAAIFSKVGSLMAGFGSQACPILWIDEAEMPETLVK